MFGYIRPYKPELKMKDFESFKACYCALCHTLGKEYGFSARCILNFDFTFMAMLLWTADSPVCYTARRCPVSPLKKKCICCYSDSLSIAAGYSVILSWWKLKDSVQDDTFFKASGARLAMLCLRRAYIKAKKQYPEFDGVVSERLAALSALEKENCSSLDKVSDCFAGLLAAAAKGVDLDRDNERIYHQIFYHMGRWIYIVDAVNDIDEDLKHKCYNPVASRYRVKSRCDAAQLEELKVTLNHSLNLIISAYGLLRRNPWTDISENIIYLGMPYVSSAVFDGTFKNKRDGVPR